MKSLINLLREPSVGGVDIDGEGRLEVHGEMLARKKMLRQVFTEFHHTFRTLDDRYFSAEGKRIELGAGVAPVKDSYPDVMSTDVVYSKNLDQVLDAEDMDLPDGSVRSFYAQNCFHHFPHPRKFFSELSRVLAHNGGAILLEPYYGFAAEFLYKRLFSTEGFDKAYQSWETPVAGPMNGANQALSYIVFNRDRKLFEKSYPDLKIVHQELCSNQLKYLLSGGLNFRQILPDWMIPFVDLMQKVQSPLNRWTSLHHIVVLRKE